MDDPACTVSSARIEDIPSMLEVEKKHFDICWRSKEGVLQRLIKKDPRMFRVCKAGGVLKGYYGVIPLSYVVWRKVIKGEITEDEAMRYVLPFSAPEVYLYIYSVIVDISDKRRKVFTRSLVRDFAREYIMKSSHKRFRYVGAFTVSEGGRRLLERSDFIFKGSFRAINGTQVRSYIINQESLIRQVEKSKQQRSQKRIA
jgi:hypothetical protein